MTSLALPLLLGTTLIQPVSQIPANDSIKQKELKEITVYSSISDNLSLPIVTAGTKTLNASSYFTPADALQREAGISLMRDAVWATSLNIRGLSEQRLLVLVDGDRIQTATDIAAALSLVDMNNLSKIEVVKGAGSVLYGTGAMGGVVNFVTQTPVYSKLFNVKGNVGTEFNTVNSLWGNFANVQFTTNQWYLALNGSFRTAGDIMTPQGVLDNSRFHDASWGLKGGILYSPNQEVVVNYQHFGGWDIGLPGGSAFPATAVARYKSVSRNQLSGEYIVTDITPNLQKVSLKAYSQNINRDVEVKPADPTVTLNPKSVNTTYGAKLTSDWRFTDYHLLTLGAEGWQRDASTLRTTKKQLTDTTYTVTGDQPTPKSKMLDLGVFAHYSWQLVPRKWTLDAGLRLDYIRTANDSAFSPFFKYSSFGNPSSSLYQTTRTEPDIPYYEPNLPRRLLFPAAVNFDLAYAAHVDVVYSPTARQQLALSLANSYRAASIEERFKFIELSGPKHVGNPALKPERGTFSNLNYSIFRNKFRFKVDVYANYLNDLIAEVLGNYTYVNASGVTTTEQAYVNQNINKALFLGAEMETNWQISREFSFYTNASYTTAKDIVANTFLPQIPPLHGFAEINYQSKKLYGVSVSTLWAAKQAQIAQSETATDGHIIFSADAHSGNIELNNSHLEFFAGVNNILNTAYIDHLSSTRGILKLEPGRNIYLKVKWGW